MKKMKDFYLVNDRNIYDDAKDLLFLPFTRVVLLWCGCCGINGRVESQDLCLWLEMVVWWSKNHGPQFEKPHLSILGSHLSIFGHFSIGRSWLDAMRWSRVLSGLISVVGSWMNDTHQYIYIYKRKQNVSFFVFHFY